MRIYERQFRPLMLVRKIELLEGTPAITVSCQPRGDYGKITFLDWDPIGGYEFGYIVPDPTNPNIVFAGGPGRGLVRIDRQNRQVVTVSANVSRDGDYRTAVNSVGHYDSTLSIKVDFTLFLSTYRIESYSTRSYGISCCRGHFDIDENRMLSSFIEQNDLC